MAVYTKVLPYLEAIFFGNVSLVGPISGKKCPVKVVCLELLNKNSQERLVQ